MRRGYHENETAKIPTHGNNIEHIDPCAGSRISAENFKNVIQQQHFISLWEIRPHFFKVV